MKNGRAWALLLMVGLGIAAAALIASPAGAWLLHPATPVAREVRTLFYKAVAVTAFFFILAEGLLLIAVLRFRAKPGVPAATWHENFKLEIVWTAIPAIAMVILSGPAFTTMKYMETTPKSELQIEVVGHQWFWEYCYPKYGVIYANEPLVVPFGKIISANVTSIDVVHSWFVPDFGIKMDANPGRINHVWFQVDHPGTYKGQCAELCGVLHGQMFITVNVVTPEEFERWIEQKKKGA
ncbi:MAG: cytochrome c oxidase subunit II [Candidatus Eisenbacteria bacterium]|uniref:Cytochrome c oxidase subunit 2 n=1 Tax=Eiseniibacteriota bacterium TaxID=2212470 RepID=A0A538SMB2_UNCEI|nr:MAG: cytochrome c oxidase subunit II [Candidatus Eisenbacteria bacterium]